MSSQPNSAAPIRLLDIRPRGGNRQHFYHFLTGVLLPLCRYLAQITDGYIPMIIQSCGPMDVLLHELQLPRMMLAETSSFGNIARTLPPQLLDRVSLGGFDIGGTIVAYNDDGGIVAGRDFLLERLKTDIEKQRAQLELDWIERPRILIIDRGPPDPFYNSWLSRARKPGAGAARRRTGNHEEMVTGVQPNYPGTRNVMLEGKSLSAQIALFQLADVVVAQHGAALSNMIWMRPDARVIELNGGETGEPFFSGLAPLTGLIYQAFKQDGPFGPVDPAALTAAIGDVLAQRAPSQAAPAFAAATTR